MMQKSFAALICCLLAGSIARAQTTVDLRDMIARTAPATVAVKTKPNLPSGILDQANRLDRFGEFGSRVRLRMDSITSGYQTGFFVTADLVLVSKESINDQLVQMVTADGKQVEGSVVVVDDVTGLALAQVDVESASTIDSHADQVEVGLPVVVHYLRKGKTPVSISSMIGSYPDSYRPMLGYGFSVNATLPPEAVGAPVLDQQGTLIGVVVSSLDGMMFCLPTARLLDRMIDANQDDEPVALRRGRLGVAVEPDADVDAGVRISSVTAGSAAAAAGIQEGDFVVSINGRYPCRTADDLLAAVAMFRSGDEITVQLKRDAEAIETTVTLSSPKVVDAVSIESDVLEQIPGGMIFKDGKISRIGPDGKPSTFNLDDFKLGNLQIERSAMEQAIKQLEQQVEKLRQQIEATEDDE